MGNTELRKSFLSLYLANSPIIYLCTAFVTRCSLGKTIALIILIFIATFFMILFRFFIPSSLVLTSSLFLQHIVSQFVSLVKQNYLTLPHHQLYIQNNLNSSCSNRKSQNYDLICNLNKEGRGWKRKVFISDQIKALKIPDKCSYMILSAETQEESWYYHHWETLKL